MKALKHKVTEEGEERLKKELNFINERDLFKFIKRNKYKLEEYIIKDDKIIYITFSKNYYIYDENFKKALFIEINDININKEDLFKEEELFNRE